MGNYEQLKQSVSDVIKTNGNQEITGSILQNVLLTIISSVGANATFAGVATPATNPGTPDGPVFYLASESGTYTNFNALELQDGLSVLMWNGSWDSQQILSVDDVPTAGSDNLVKSGGVQEELALGAVYDVSAKNPTAGPNNDGKFETLSALLEDTNLNTLIPTSVRKGGMSIKFVQSTDNKYVQYRLTADEFTTDTTKWAVYSNGVYIYNPEFIAVWTDNNKKILIAVENDGNVFYGAGVPRQIIDYINEKIAELSLEDIVTFLGDLIYEDKTLQELLNEKVDKEEGKSLIPTQYIQEIDNPEFIAVWTTPDKKILLAIKSDADVIFGCGVPSAILKYIHNYIYTGNNSISKYLAENYGLYIEDVEGRMEIKTDVFKRIIKYRDGDGRLYENVGITTNSLHLSETGMTEFQQALKDAGFQPGGAGDFTDKSSMQIPIPSLAFINITAPNGNIVWPISKTNDYNYYMEFYDGAGNYFKKEIIFNAQGRSSMNFAKKNGAVDICNNNGWDDDDTFKIKFGEWVPQDSFHFKAYYTDFFRGINVIAYKMMANIWKSRGTYKDKPYKRILLPTLEDIGYSHDTMITEIDDVSLQIDNGARCIPDGFPAIFYLNGEFYGIYSWQLKKHRDNYHMKKDNGKHIHLDGNINNSKLFGANGNIDNIDFNPDSWAGFEIRNPKDIWTTEGEKYDADVSSRQVPVDSTTAEQWIEAGVLPNGTAITSKIAKQLRYTAKVRQYILTLSTYIPTLQYMRTGGSSDADIRAKIEEYFDVDSLIDYILFSSVIDNWDGFSANWQWTTWDGVKWSVCPYDMDNIVGAMEQGNVVRNYNANKFANTNRDLPSGWITTYYQAELKARWEELVQKELITPDTFVGHLMSWLGRIGENNFDKEYKKWYTTPCNRESNQNSDYWNYTGQYMGGTLPSTDAWDSGTTYAIGNKVWFKAGSRCYQFEAVAANTNQKPIKDADLYTDGSPALGFRDSIYRVINTYNHNYMTFNNFISNLNV